MSLGDPKQVQIGLRIWRIWQKSDFLKKFAGTLNLVMMHINWKWIKYWSIQTLNEWFLVSCQAVIALEVYFSVELFCIFYMFSYDFVILYSA